MKNNISKLKIAITSDHAGFELKQKIRYNLENLGLGVLDLGPNNSEPVDYPDFGKAIAEEMDMKPAVLNKAIRIAYKNEFAQVQDSFSAVEEVLQAVGRDN